MRSLVSMFIFLTALAVAQAKEQARDKEAGALRPTVGSSSSVQSSGELAVTPARQAPRPARVRAPDKSAERLIPDICTGC
jgi:hypothetical protein